MEMKEKDTRPDETEKPVHQKQQTTSGTHQSRNCAAVFPCSFLMISYNNNNNKNNNM